MAKNGTNVKNRVIRGTFGRLWMNGELMGHVKSFEAKVTHDFDDIEVNGDFGTKHRYMGYSISGTVTLHKIDSRILAMYAKAAESGQIPDVRFDSALVDPDSPGAERVAVGDVQFEELTLAQWENKTVLEESIPFNAGWFEILETIA